ncbi:hypothetical protein M433DRAFT_165358 [Acidomyces richmondensis BFW]|nr:MAG: hypothetical protein FE78DRAFT_106699 [Acidomyces sp. 'richmondensis']KYG46296.1 hypothetical protein M433DRAFT_165358 [Acidomyces richmondensis BFW]
MQSSPCCCMACSHSVISATLTSYHSSPFVMHRILPRHANQLHRLAAGRRMLHDTHTTIR